VVVTVVVENAGAGSEVAGPIVREVMAELLSRHGAL
jgi:cell division protein FtsI/penicillin-binding protein 2